MQVEAKTLCVSLSLQWIQLEAARVPFAPTSFAVHLRDDVRAYLPELLPRFVSLFAEAERSGDYDMVRNPSADVGPR